MASIVTADKSPVPDMLGLKMVVGHSRGVNKQVSNLDSGVICPKGKAGECTQRESRDRVEKRNLGTMPTF